MKKYKVSGYYKIKVKPEGREGIWLPEKESLKKFIKKSGLKQIHNMIPSGPMVIGANHDVKSILKDIDMADRLGILTGNAQRQNFGHALSLIKNEKLGMYDIGNITEENLEII